MKTILFVDDDVDVQNLSKSFLEKKDFKVEIVSDGEEAIKKYADIKPHVMVVDYKLPGIDGLQTSKTILENHPDATIFLITAYADDVLFAKAIKLGIRDCFSKPCIMHLMKAIEIL